MSLQPSDAIRVGTESDLPRVLELIVELAIFEKEPTAVETTVESMRRDGFGEHPLFEFFVAEDADQQIVGLSIFYWRYSTWKGKRLYLEDLIVTESARGQGYGKALFDRTVQYAAEQSCTGMMWQVLDWNQSAIDFYKRYQASLDGEWINCRLDRSTLLEMAKRVDSRG